MQGDAGTTNLTYIESLPDIQQGYFGTYANCDNNLAYSSTFVPSNLTHKWEYTGYTIGEPGAMFFDGTDASGIANNTLFYGGWYNYNNFLHKTWHYFLPGSVVSDVNSDSLAFDMRSGINWAWAADALYYGASAAAGVISEPFVPGNPRPNIMLSYYLKGFTFAEIAMYSNPTIGWMPVYIGDPLLAPFASKTPAKDTHGPVISSGYPIASWDPLMGLRITVFVDDSSNPEVVRAYVNYRKKGTTPYHREESTIPYARMHQITIHEIEPQITYEYTVVVTDPAGHTASASGTFFCPDRAKTLLGKAIRSDPRYIFLHF